MFTIIYLNLSEKELTNGEREIKTGQQNTGEEKLFENTLTNMLHKESDQATPSQANSRQPHNDLKLYQSDMIVIFGVKHLEISQKDGAKK